MTRSWDVIIVGAGPAGSVLASLLGARGTSVLLLDRAVFPRDKLCGEFLNPGGVEILGRLGCLDVVQSAAFVVRGMKFLSPDGTAFRGQYSGARYGLAVRRTELDSLLLQHAGRAGAEVLEGFRVDRLISGGVEGRTRNATSTLRARVVVGADGRNSIVARQLGLFRPHPTHRKMALGRHYQGLTEYGDCGEIFCAGFGYGVINPLGSGIANVCLVVDAALLARARGKLGPYFDELLQRMPRLARRLADAAPLEDVHALGPMAHSPARVWAPGALLVGDAAGFYDPFTGEGMFMALRSAELAAAAIVESLDGSRAPEACFRDYERRLRSELRGRFRLEALLQRVIARPWVINLFARRLRTKREAATTLMDAIAGLAAPGSLLNPSFAGAILTP